MSTASERAKDRRSLRLECLEDRNLLSVVKPPAIVAEAASTTAAPITSITGQIVGSSAPQGLYGGTHSGFNSYSGHGNAKPIGVVFFGSQQLNTTSTTSTPPLSITHGSAILRTIKGEQIVIAYTGTGQAARHATNVTLQGQVLNGTGRFASVIGGTFTATGPFATGTGKFHLNFSLSLIYNKI